MKKKKVTIIAIVIAIIIIVTGGIFAYLTDTDQATNVFTVGSVKINVTEANWNASNGQNVVPNQTIAKDPQIDNVGSNSAYVYIKVEQPNVSLSNGTTGPLFNYTINSGWTLLGDNSSSTGCPTRTAVYYYNTALNPSTSTSKLFNNVTTNEYNQDSVPDNTNIEVTGYAIQSSYLPSGTTIQSAYNTYFDNSGIGDCNIRTIYRWSTSYLSNGDNISSLTLGTDYEVDKSQVTNITDYLSLAFLKHDIENNIVTHSYVCFTIQRSTQQEQPELTAGEYCLEGGDSGASYTTNKAKLITAFGSTNCTDYTSRFSCSEQYGLGVSAYDEGYVIAGVGDYGCAVYGNGDSIC